MMEMISELRDKKDSIGGTLTCVVKNFSVGLGEPVFDRLEAKLARAILSSIPATKGFEIGSGFKGTEMTGSNHNDLFEMKNGILGTKLIIVEEFKEVFQTENHYFLK